MILGGELLDIKGAILIEVESSEGPLNKIPPELAHLTDDNSQKFIKVHLSALINVHGLEEALDVLGIDLDAEVIAALLELLEVKATTAVVVSYLKLPAEADDAIGTACLQGLPEPLDQDALELWDGWLALNFECWLVLWSASVRWSSSWSALL